MMKTGAIIVELLVGSCLMLAQNPGGGTVNSMSTDPEQNQKMTGTMGTTTGQPNDVTPGSGAATALGNPSTRTTKGSDSNGTHTQGRDSKASSGSRASQQGSTKSKAAKQENSRSTKTQQSSTSQPQ